jgi:hypothetical protein
MDWVMQLAVFVMQRERNIIKYFSNRGLGVSDAAVPLPCVPQPKKGLYLISRVPSSRALTFIRSSRLSRERRLIARSIVRVMRRQVKRCETFEKFADLYKAVILDMRKLGVHPSYKIHVESVRKVLMDLSRTPAFE